MRRSFPMMGLLVALGCDGVETDRPAPEQAVEQDGVREEAVMPRVDLFAPLPSGAAAAGGIRPEAWARPTQAALPVENQYAQGRFDPAELQMVEAHRANAKLLRGVK